MMLKHAFYRFWATIFCCLLFYALAIGDQNYLLPIPFIGSLWFVACQLFLERRPSWSRPAAHGVAIAVFGIVAAYIYVFLDRIVLNSALFGIGTLALLPIAPFIGRKESGDAIFVFSYKIARQVLLGAICSAIVFAGIVAILASVGALFEVSYENLLPYIFWAVPSLFFSIFTLSGIPKDFDSNRPEKGVDLIYSLIGFLIIPLLSFYCAILHWYFLVLVGTQSLPQGVIVLMTSGFAGLGILTYLAVNHSQAAKLVTIVFFKKHFFKFLLIPLVLMAAAIGIRLNQHGMTENRFLVVMWLLWLCLVAGFSISKREKDMSQFAYLGGACLVVLTAVLINLSGAA